MEVKLVSFESMGIRSICTFVRTPEIAVLVDPGAACHFSSGLKPHPLEYEALIGKRSEMQVLSQEADVVVTSHYHLDHLTPVGTDLAATFSTTALADRIYSGKIVFCKDPDANVTDQQGQRGKDFRRLYSGKVARYETTEGKEFAFGRTRIAFSPPLWHGKEGTTQGYVVGTCVDDGDRRIVHASDVQLLNEASIDWMLSKAPWLGVIVGPPIFDRERAGRYEMDLSLKLLRRLAAGVPELVVDHHLLRSRDWQRFFDLAKDVGCTVKCAAWMQGVPVLDYEARRQDLYELEEVDEKFHGDLERGRVPDRLRSALEEAGIDELYKAALGR